MLSIVSGFASTFCCCCILVYYCSCTLMKLSCLCLLDIAAFDTHSPFILVRHSLICPHTPTYHLAPSVSDVITLSSPCIIPPVVSPKASFSVLCFTSCTLPPEYSHLPFPQPPPLCTRHPTVFLISPTQLRLKHYPPIKCLSANLFLDDFQSPNSQFLQD